MGGRSGLRVAALIAVLAATAVVASGCDYLLYGTPLMPVPSFDPDASYDPNASSDPLYPKPLATYDSGTATLAIDGGAPRTLDLQPGAKLFDAYGADVVWTSGDGWFVRVTAAQPGTLDFYPATITFDWIADGRHWTIWDSYDKCKVEVPQGPDTKGMSGTATCTGLRWTDQMGPPSTAYEIPPVEGQAPFDAVVTFEAKS